MQLSPVTEKFVLHWGEMGSRWGVNRTVAQIHALLFMAERPLDAEEIAATLGVARSNVSTSLRELQNWGLVKVVHVMGDRRDQFETYQDIWQLFTVVVEERRRREIDPTLLVLRECVVPGPTDSTEETAAREKISKVLDFLEILTQWHNDMKRLSPETLKKILRLGSKLGRLIN